MSLSICDLHTTLSGQRARPLSFSPERPFGEQKKALYEKLRELIGLPERVTAPQPLIEYEKHDDERFDEIRFRFESEPDFFVPAHLLLPKGRTAPLPVVICLQGHTPGMFLSMGRYNTPHEEELVVRGDRDLAIQAVSHGYAAVVMEQRGFGELKTTVAEQSRCHHPAMQALLLGRTLVGERVFDVSQLISLLPYFGELDCSRIGLTGHSAGGTTTYYAACLDERIYAAMPSCCFGPLEDSFLLTHHCSCGYIPGMLNWFDMPDLAAAIAPRPLVIVAGEGDGLVTGDSVRRGFKTVQQAYSAAGVPDLCQLVIGDGGHRFYAADAWPVFTKVFNKK